MQRPDYTAGSEGHSDGEDGGVEVPEVPEHELEVRRSTIHGQGVFARRRIPAATRIIEYTGELISAEEADRRYDDDSIGHHTFLFALGNGLCIDARAAGNMARFINHSCEPSCEAVEIGDHVWIEAIREIAAGEELTYDYGYAWEPGDEARTSLYACRCGASSCRKSILTPPTVPEDTSGEKR